MTSSIVNNFVSVTSPMGAPSGWTKAISNALLPHSYLLNFHVETWGWAAVISMLEDGSYYLAGIRPDGRPFIDFLDYAGSAYACVIELPDPAPIEGDVQIAFREMRYGDTGSSVWQSISMW